MLYSMTGYGEAEVESCGIVFSAQLRTVNNKYFKTSLKLPEMINFLEEHIEKLLRDRFSRGSLNLTVSAKSIKQQPLIGFNSEAIEFYVEQLSRHGQSSNAVRINTSNLLHLPGVIEPFKIDTTQRETIKVAVGKLIEEASANLIDMRKKEGIELELDLLLNCDQIAELLNKIIVKVPLVVSQYKDRLEQRVNELLKDAKVSIDETILIKEAAVFADRSDISEEVSRLNCHLKQFRVICSETGSNGKRLDFLSQEMFREANTIGSKASDAEICQLVVDVKSRIDRIKEQVQNVE